MNICLGFLNLTGKVNCFLEVYEKLATKFYNARDATDFQNDYLMSCIAEI